MSRVSREKPIRERATSRAHDWKVKSHANLEVFASVLRVRLTYEVLAKHSIWKKVVFALLSLYPHYIYLNYPQIIRSSFQRENPKKYT